MKSPSHLEGMFGFTVACFGQFVSMLGSGLTRFALIFWLYGETGEATSMSLLAFFSFAPTIVLSPVAGVLVDRWNRKLVMMLSDLAAGLGTAAILVLLSSGHLEIWHLYLLGAWSGAFEAFQWPAYSAAVTTMVSKRHYARANGMLSLAGSSSMIFAPVLAAFLLMSIGIVAILVIDIATFMVAIGTLLFVHIPQPLQTETGKNVRRGLLSESIYGFKYILRHKSLLGLQIVPLLGNFFDKLSMVLLPAMILARTGNDVFQLGMVEAALGAGGVVGGLAMALGGGPKRRIHGVLLGWMLCGLLGHVLMGMGQRLRFWIASGFLNFFFGPFIDGSGQAIWQAKVAPDVQGKIFGIRRLIAHLGSSMAMLVAGPLADDIFELNLMPQGPWSNILGWLVGIGPGAGMGLIFVLTGLMMVAVGLSGYLIPAIRQVEEILPDYL